MLEGHLRPGADVPSGWTQRGPIHSDRIQDHPTKGEEIQGHPTKGDCTDPGTAGVPEALERIATTDVDEALGVCDVVWVCTPTSTHAQIVERCVARGIPIYCEKPLAKDLASAESIARSVIRSRMANQVGLVLRYTPPFEAMAALCRGGALAWEGAPGPDSTGRPMAALLRDDQCFPIGGMYGSDWRADAAIAGGGALIEHSIHDLDALSWMFGPVVSVTARTNNHAGHPGVEDVATATLEHSSGVLSTLLSVWHGLETRPSTRRLEVFFERAHAVLEDEHVGPVRVERATGTVEIGVQPEAEEMIASIELLGMPRDLACGLLPYARSDLAFLREVAGATAGVGTGQTRATGQTGGTGQGPARAAALDWGSPSVEVAIEAHRVLDAAYRSAALGGAAQFPARNGNGEADASERPVNRGADPPERPVK